MDNLQHPWEVVLVLYQNAEVIRVGQVVDLGAVNGVAAARGGQALQQPVDGKVEENWAEGAALFYSSFAVDGVCGPLVGSDAAGGFAVDVYDDVQRGSGEARPP